MRRYVVKRKVAQGGMGEVWAGEHTRLPLRVAIKLMRPELQTNHEIVTRFAREAFLLGQIQSDHVARAYDFSVGGKYGPMLVMEFIEGVPLSSVMHRKRFSIEEAIDLGIDIASALRELHTANIVHRDVKPGNLIMRPVRDGVRAVFVDLGVSRFVQSEKEEDQQLTEITSADRAVGTIEYMAPEQILCSRDVTPAADLWALGAILHQAVTGHHVYGDDLHGMSLTRVKLTSDPPPMSSGRTDRIARGFEEVVSRALQRTPKERYEIADELLTDLSLLRDAARRVAATKTPNLPVRSTPKEVAVPPSPRRRARWGYALLVLALVASGALVALMLLRHVSVTIACAPT